MAKVYRINDTTGKRYCIGSYDNEYRALDIAERAWIALGCHIIVTVNGKDYAEYEV